MAEEERRVASVEDEQPTIPYIAYESVLARNERTVKRLIICLLMCTLLLLLSNCAWLYAWCQYEYVDETETTTTVTQDGEGQNVYGDNNRVNDGAEDSNSPEKTQTDDTEEER